MSGTVSGIRFTPIGDDINIEIFQGRSLNFSLVWGGDTPIDITGYEAAFVARDYNKNIMLNCSTETEGLLIDGAAGKLTVFATPERTRQVSRPGLYEMKIVTPDGAVFRVLSGTVYPVQEIA